MRCLGCGYELSNLLIGRCPECGRGFDRANPATFQWTPVNGLAHAGRAFAGLVLCIVPFVVLYATPASDHSRDYGMRALDLAAKFAGLFGIWLAFGSAYAAYRGLRKPWVKQRWCCVVALAPALIISLAFISMLGLAVWFYVTMPG